MEKLREQYEKEVVPALMKKFNCKSIMEVPKLEKIVLNVGLGDIRENPKALENTMNDLSSENTECLTRILSTQSLSSITYSEEPYSFPPV